MWVTSKSPPHIARLELYRPHLNYRHSWPTRGHTDMDSQQQQEQAPRSAGHYTTLTDPTFLVSPHSPSPKTRQETAG